LERREQAKKSIEGQFGGAGQVKNSSKYDESGEVLGARIREKDGGRVAHVGNGAMEMGEC